MILFSLGIFLFNKTSVFANTSFWKDKLKQYLSSFQKTLEEQFTIFLKNKPKKSNDKKTVEIKTNIQITTVIKNTTPTPTTNSNNQIKTQNHYRKTQPTPTLIHLQNFKLEYNIKIPPFKTTTTLPLMPTFDTNFLEEFNKKFEETRKKQQEIEKEQEEFFKKLCQEYPDAEIWKEKNF